MSSIVKLDHHPFIPPNQVIQNIFKKTLERKACFSAGIEVNRPLDILPGAEEIRVLLLGDWGSGSIEQKNIAEKSAVTCDQLGCDLVLMMGDNFIQHGVENLDDPQFQEKFEKVYTQKVPFYPVLGNHDLRGTGGHKWNTPTTVTAGRCLTVAMISWEARSSSWASTLPARSAPSGNY